MKYETLLNQEPIYIFGHQHPDTDSIVSAIAYAMLKRMQGVRAIPCRLGELSCETKYLLDRFGFEEPVLLEDARKTLKEIDLDEPDAILYTTTIYETINRMRETSRAGFAVVDESGTVIGYVSKSDLANLSLSDTAMGIDLLQHITVDDLVKTLNGKTVYSDDRFHLNGKVSIIAMTQSGVEFYEVKDRIVIVGNDPEAQKDLIRKGAGLLIVVWTERIEADVIGLAREHHCPIILSGHGTMNTSRYLFFSPRIEQIMRRDPTLLPETMLVEAAAKKIGKTRFRNYPVVDKKGVLVGYVTRRHLMEYHNKKVILVDHNEFSQSVKAVEKAKILEVVDHHRINDFATSQPVAFRNEIIGSTATIIAGMYRENQIPIPKELAGILLGAILSDTLLLQSPTTTKKDVETVNILAALADVEIETFGKELFSASAQNLDKSMYEMIVQDIKYYDIDGCRTMISQNMVPSSETLADREEEIQAALEKLVRKKHLDLMVAVFSSVEEEGSVLFCAGEMADRCRDAFPNKTEDGHDLQKGLFSRKSQILPALTKELES